MKTVISLGISSIFFLTQTLAIAHPVELQAPTGGEDQVIKIAAGIEEMGEKLQEVSDQKGFEGAYEMLEQLNQQGEKKIKEEATAMVLAMSQEEVEAELSNIKQAVSLSIDDESLQSVLQDRNLTAREKLGRLYAGFSTLDTKAIFSELKKQFETVGFEKTFSDFAERLRSRDPENPLDFLFKWDLPWQEIVWKLVRMGYIGLLVSVGGPGILIWVVLLWTLYYLTGPWELRFD